MFENKCLIFIVLLMLTSQCSPVENVCPPCECGRINRITGAVVGEDVQTNEFPWITEILYQSNNWCHGSLINSRYVLTTAWCVGESTNTGDWSVRLLIHNVRPKAEKFITRKISQIIVNRRHLKEPNSYADIALLQLEKDVELSSVVAPICLPLSDHHLNGSTAVFAHGAHPILHKFRFTINDYKNCHIVKDTSKSLSQDDKLCAETHEEEGTWCDVPYNVGAPLQLRYNNTGAYHLIGMLSYRSRDDCTHKKPMVFSRINYFLKWILKNTLDACPCFAFNENSQSLKASSGLSSIVRINNTISNPSVEPRETSC